jgi:hypothetical protein
MTWAVEEGLMRAAIGLLEHEEKRFELLRAALDAESEDLDGVKVFARLRR